MTENKTSRGFFILKINILGFGLLALPEITIMLYQLILSFQADIVLNYGYLSTLQFVFNLIVILGFLLLAFGIYSFSLFQKNELKKEGKLLSGSFLIIFTLMLFTSILGVFLSLMIGDFQMVSTLLVIAENFFSNNRYKDWAGLWAVFNLAISISLFVLMARFSTWVKKAEIDGFNKGPLLLIISSGFYFFASIFTFISISILFPPIHVYNVHPLSRISGLESIMGIIALEDVVEAQILSYLFNLAGLIIQFCGSLIIFRDLNRLSRKPYDSR